MPRHRAVVRRRLPRVGLGAAAVAVAAVLLLGGHGSLAQWVASGSVSPGGFTSGTMGLVPVTSHGSDGCNGWTFASTGGTSTGAVSASTPLQPGDVLTDDCYYTLKLSGDHLSGTYSISYNAADVPSYAQVDLATSDLDGQPNAAKTFKAPQNNGSTLHVQVRVTVSSGYTTHPASPATFSLPSLSVGLTQGVPS